MIATVFIWDFMSGVFDRRVRFSSCVVYAYLGTIQGELYPLIDGWSFV